MGAIISRFRRRIISELATRWNVSSFIFVRYLLFNAGLSPDESSFLSRSFPLLLSGSLCTTILLQIISLYQFFDQDYRACVRYAMGILIRVTVLVKLGNMYHFRREISQAFQELEDIILAMKKDIGNSIPESSERRAKQLTALAVIFSSVFGAGMMSLSFKCYAKRTIPWVGYFPYDVSKSPMFDVSVAVIVTSVAVGIIVVIVCDLLMFIPLVHTVGAFKMLREELECMKDMVKKRIEFLKLAEMTSTNSAEDLNVPFSTIVEVLKTKAAYHLLKQKLVNKLRKRNEGNRIYPSFPGSRRTQGVIQKELQKDQRSLYERIKEMMEVRMKQCVINHTTLIRLTREGNRVVNPVLIWQLVVTLLTALAGFYITTLSKEFGNYEMLIMVGIFGIFVELFIQCWFADFLTTESELLTDSAYACDWLHASPRFKSALRILMARSQKPLHIRALGIPFSRRMFKTICRGAYYSHAVFQNLYFGVKIGQRD